MFLLTGKHKTEYDRVIREAAAAQAQFGAHEREIARLEKRLAWAEEAWKYERERADRAADALLATKGLPPIIPDAAAPSMGEDPYSHEDPAQVEKILKGMGLVKNA